MKPAAQAAGRIGPNAITRIAEALPPLVGADRTRSLFERAGLLDCLREPPQGMVAETDVARLHRQLRIEFDEDLAREAARRAGTLTGDYLLARRIPRLVQWLLAALPPAAAARVLVSAIRRHAWTFCGSGAFSARFGPTLQLSIRGNPLCKELQLHAPACDYFAATFERLFRALVQRDAHVTETLCEARGDVECRFEVRW